MRRTCLTVVGLGLLITSIRGEAVVSGELKVWHPVTLTVQGPEASETGDPNPFRDFRMAVTFFLNDGHAFTVPGYFAADGRAADSGADSGSSWRAHFTPDRPGTWNYRVWFREGPDVAVNGGGRSVESVHERRGSFLIEESDKRLPDIRAHGRLRYVGSRYLRFAGSGQWFLKGGADSPENFLAYHEFDGTYSVRQSGTHRSGEAATAPLHRYEPHLQDWQAGDPVWKDGKGKAIIGALNYLASQGVNSVYFLTMNVAGDGHDVWPWTGHAVRDRFDCSKLDQWNIVFDHMTRLGIALHVVLTETENESLFEVEEGGSFAFSRKLYYRELVARFAHHPALVWNLGEENGWDDLGKETTGEAGLPNTHAQRRAFAAYLHELDVYDHPVVVHTLPGRYDEIYTPLLGFESFEGPSLQMGDMRQVYSETLKWIQRSEKAGRPWVVNLDEIGPASDGVKPDSVDPEHNAVRQYALWGNLMAGGGGVEWYFGYQHPHNDLNLEDFRSREKMWAQTRHAVDFFQRYLPFAEMTPGAEPEAAAGGWSLEKPGEVYAVYLPDGSQGATVALPPGRYSIRWYDPRLGGELQSGSLETAATEDAGALVSLGLPPSETSRDWVVLVRPE